MNSQRPEAAALRELPDGSLTGDEVNELLDRLDEARANALDDVAFEVEAINGPEDDDLISRKAVLAAIDSLRAKP